MIIKRNDLNKYKASGREGHKSSKESLLECAQMHNTSGYEFVGGEGYLSPSSIKTWMKCPRFFYYDKLDPDLKVRRVNLKMHYGSSGHKAMEILYKKILKNEAIIKEEIVSYATDYYQRGLEDPEVPMDEKENLQASEFDEVVGTTKDNLVVCVEAYVDNKEHEKVGQILNVEQDFLMTLDGIPFYGIVDLETSSKIVDFKFAQGSAGVQMRKSDIPGDIQLWTYEKNYSKPGAFNIIIPPPKTKRSERHLVTEICRTDYLTWADDDFMEVTHDMLREIQAGRFTKRGAITGGCQGCRYKEACNVKHSV